MSESLKTENIFVLSWPMMVSQLAITATIFIDYLFLSYLSVTYVAVVSQVGTLVFLGLAIAPAVFTTGIAVSGQYMGANKHDKVVPIYMFTVALGVCMGILVFLLIWANHDLFGSVLGLNDELNSISSRYFYVIAWYFIFMGPMVAYSAICASKGETFWIMVISVASTVFNALLNFVLIFWFKMDLEGVIFGTVLTSFFALLGYIYIVHVVLKVRFVSTPLGVFRELVQPIRRVAIPSVIEPVSYASQQIALSLVIIGLGVEAMAAHGFTHRLISFPIMVIISLGSGVQILLGHYMGQKAFGKVNQVFWKGIRLSVLIAFVPTVCFWLFSDQFFSIFTSDNKIIQVATFLLLVSLIGEPAKAINVMAGGALRTVGDGKFSATMTLIFIWGLIPIILFLDANWVLTIGLVWILLTSDELIRSIINLWRWHTGHWKNKGLVKEDNEDFVVAQEAAS